MYFVPKEYENISKPTSSERKVAKFTDLIFKSTQEFTDYCFENGYLDSVRDNRTFVKVDLEKGPVAYQRVGKKYYPLFAPLEPFGYRFANKLGNDVDIINFVTEKTLNLLTETYPELDDMVPTFKKVIVNNYGEKRIEISLTQHLFKSIYQKETDDIFLLESTIKDSPFILTEEAIQHLCKNIDVSKFPDVLKRVKQARISSTGFISFENTNRFYINISEPTETVEALHLMHCNIVNQRSEKFVYLKSLLANIPPSIEVFSYIDSLYINPFLGIDVKVDEDKFKKDTSISLVHSKENEYFYINPDKLTAMYNLSMSYADEGMNEVLDMNKQKAAGIKYANRLNGRIVRMIAYSFHNDVIRAIADYHTSYNPVFYYDKKEFYNYMKSLYRPNLHHDDVDDNQFLLPNTSIRDFQADYELRLRHFKCVAYNEFHILLEATTEELQNDLLSILMYYNNPV